MYEPLYNEFMKIIVGLGNPGEKYENTRHNAGFHALDMLREKLGFPEFRVSKKFASETNEGNFSGEKFLLAKPLTYMNLSGKAVRALFDFYGIEPADLWVFYDDIDLPIGKIRVRNSGSAGTHNGMKSIITSLGFQNFPRIRIGIGMEKKNAKSKQDLSSYVLHPFSRKEKPTFKKTLENACSAFFLAIEDGISRAQERFN